ncbi:hypothetical protein ACIBP6_38380 [Nonomuraea terrae]|uniref:hypothetical protein n=1 Tax=Nonomuraea terrae TaxID=2530383 RepID=UPI0037A10B26
MVDEIDSRTEALVEGESLVKGRGRRPPVARPFDNGRTLQERHPNACSHLYSAARTTGFTR